MSEDLSGKNLVELLDLLEPAPEPVAVSLLPQTAGWIWLVFALGLTILLLARWSVRAHRSNAYRRIARREILQARSDPEAIARILRQTALVAYPREKVAGLHGEAWLDFLDQSYGGSGFRSGAGRAVASAPYVHTPSLDGLADIAIEWVRKHRPVSR